MVNNKSVKEFIDFAFVPFSKSQCIKRLLCIWLFSAVLCFIGGYSKKWMVLLCAANIVTSVLFIMLITKLASDRISRYLCDGIFYLHTAIIFNMASYRVITLLIKPNWILLLILLILLVACVAIFLLVTLQNIKSGKFSGINGGKKVVWIPLLGSVCGIVSANLFLRGQSQQVALTVVAIVLLFLSFILCIPSINLLRAVLYQKTRQG